MDLRMRSAVLLLTFCVWVQVTGAAEWGRMTPTPFDTAQKPVGANTAFQLALFHPLQIFGAENDVCGLGLNLIYGRNTNLYGLDVGVANDKTGEVCGAQLGLGNRAGVLYGVQLGAVSVAHGETVGMQAGVLNWSKGAGNAFQCGLISIASEYSGFQLGGFNYADDYEGLQLGVVNVCNSMTGVQIGLLNFILKSQYIMFAPIFNASF